TMAMYLLKPHHPGDEDGHLAGTAASRNPLVRFQRAFEHRFERVRAGYVGLLQRALGARKPFMMGFMAVVILSFGLLPFLGSNFFPDVDAGQIAIHARAPVGSRLEDTAARFDKVGGTIRELIPAGDLGSITDN